MDRKTLQIHIRPALQWRASLNNAGDRESLLAHPDAIELPLGQIEQGGVFGVESQGMLVGLQSLASCKCVWGQDY